MSSLQQVREGLTKASDSITIGWRELRELASEKKVSRRESRGHYHVMERAYGRFERAIKLPARVDGSTARARYRHGVLTVSLPKIAEARGRRISVEER